MLSEDSQISSLLLCKKIILNPIAHKNIVIVKHNQTLVENGLSRSVASVKIIGCLKTNPCLQKKGYE